MLWGDNSAASSVIGVVLLVAVTVLVAGVAGTYVFFLADDTTGDPPPEGAFEFEYQKDGDTREAVPSDNLTITYTHGESIPSGRVNFTFTGAREINQNGNPEGTNDLYVTRELFGSGTITAGDTDTISENNVQSRSGGSLGNLRGLDLSRAEVRVYWTEKDSDRSFVIAEWEGPDA